MSSVSKDPRTRAQLLEEIEELRRRLDEADQTLEAIRSGGVDALVVANSYGEQIYTLTGAEHVYRVIVETMNEAALTVDADGTILFCNQRFCDLVKTPMQETLGRSITGFAARPQQAPLERLMTDALVGPVQRRITLQATDGVAVPVQFSASLLHANGTTSLCLVASDLTELEASANSIRVLREHQEALEASEARFRAIFESSQDAVILVDDQGVSIQANPAVETVFALPAEQLIGHALPEFVDGSTDFASIWSAFLGTGALRAELKVTDACGQVRDVDCYAVANILPGWHLAVIRDITDRKRAEKALQMANEQLQTKTGELQIQAEELHAQTEELSVANEELTVSEQALRESEQRYRGLVMASSQALYRMSPDWREMQQLDSRGFLADTERPNHAWLQEYIYPDDQPHVTVAIEEAIRTKSAFEMEHRVRRADGSLGWTLSRAVPLMDAHGEIVEWFGAASDITEQKQAEETLRESEERYHRLFEDDLTGNFLSTPEGRILLCNPPFAEIFGFSRTEDALGTSMQDMYVDPRERESMLEKLRQEGKLERLEVWRKRQDGQPIYVVENLIGHFNDQGELDEIKGYIFDDTERKRAEEALRELTRTLETRVAERTRELEHRARQLQKLALELSQAEEKERRRLAEILHDDLQQQLAAVKFHLGILSSRTRRDAHIQASAAQLDGMLKDAIETSRNLSHELSPAVMYHGDMGEIFEWLAHQIQTKHGMIVRVDPDGQIDVQSDALKIFLFKAVQEMLFNAVKHARVDEAWVRLRRRGRYVCLCVSDRGRGFDPQDLKQTAGFGLMSIRERIGLLGGRMKIHSVKGVGSRFLITVPDGQVVGETVGATLGGRPLEDRTAGDSSALEEGRHRGLPLRVLIADDHEVVRHGLASLLAEAEDIELVGQAGNGREAVDMAYQLRPDVVIMDVAMPLMNGDEATRQILRHLPQTRIVALSMYEEAGAVERMHKAGAESYILKTAPSDELLAAVRGSE